MQKVTVKWKFLAHIKEAVGFREYQMKVDPFLPRALAQLEAELGVSLQEKIGREWILLINGRPFLLKESPPLEEGDIIALVPRLGGG